MTFFHSFKWLPLLLWLQVNRIRAAPVVECQPFVPITYTGLTSNLVEYSCTTVYVFDGVTFSGGSSGLTAGSSTLHTTDVYEIPGVTSTDLYLLPIFQLSWSLVPGLPIFG